MSEEYSPNEAQLRFTVGVSVIAMAEDRLISIYYLPFRKDFLK